MKKNLLCICMLLVVSSYSFSQKARVGIQVGGALSSISEQDDIDSKFGFTGGLALDMPLSSHFIFQPQLNFVSNGGQSEGIVRVNLNSLELPLNFMYRQNNKAGFFIGAGPFVGYGLGANIKVDGEETLKLKYGNNSGDNVVRWNFGANVLAGYLLSNGLQIALNYNMGFTDINGTHGVAVDDLSKPMTRYFGLRIGYFLK